MPDLLTTLLTGLTEDYQAKAVTSPARQLLVVAGAGSGKTEVMARRIAWWVGSGNVNRDEIAAFTFTEKAAEEMKFRIRRWMAKIAPEGGDATLGRMYVGTIHGFCIQMLRELVPSEFGAYDILDDAGRMALVQRGFNGVLGLAALRQASQLGQFQTIEQFLAGYDLLNEFGELRVDLSNRPVPPDVRDEKGWIEEAQSQLDVNDDAVSQAFAVSAGRYYAYLKARRFLDFSTAQAELARVLDVRTDVLARLRQRFTHLVVDEFQDVNVVQERLIRTIVGSKGVLTAVGDHRQAIFGWRGGKVELIGRWYRELDRRKDGDVVELPHNFRSTPRIINVANDWAATIDPPTGMTTLAMVHGRATRVDRDPGHVAAIDFDDRSDEAEWIAGKIGELVRQKRGAAHDVDDVTDRGIGLPDIAILVRSSTDVRTYMETLRAHGVPAVVRAGPDLFAQPEVLLLVGALSIAAGVDEYYGGAWGRSLPALAQGVLGARAEPRDIVRRAARRLADEGLPVGGDVANRVIAAAELIRRKLTGEPLQPTRVRTLKTPPLREWLGRSAVPRRLFPQTLFQWLASEAGIADWDGADGRRAETAMFHVGQLSGLVTGIESPGWVSPDDFKWQVIALTNWAPQKARIDEAPLLVPPEAVTISTIHSAKGLEFPVVFLADVKAQRFPSSYAHRVPTFPFSGPVLDRIDPTSLADDANYNDERRLMYVALTRAERFLFVTCSGRASSFKRELERFIAARGGQVAPEATARLKALNLRASEYDPSWRLITSFSDLRYYLACPHDYYLRKALGFAPTIDQAFGYGRGIHNLMRELHEDPARWAALAADPAALASEVRKLIDDGLFYLRYTTGEPLTRMQTKARSIIEEYVRTYRDELAELTFEPERAFETLIEEANVLVAGVIDLVRRDNPPSVTLIDFKSGDADSHDDNASALNEEEMALQVAVYGLAAKAELEYEPDHGLIRYLGADRGTPREERELDVPLDAAALTSARDTILTVARDIQTRNWDRGPRSDGVELRCSTCDFLHLCGRPEARSAAR